MGRPGFQVKHAGKVAEAVHELPVLPYFLIVHFNAVHLFFFGQGNNVLHMAVAAFFSFQFFRHDFPVFFHCLPAGKNPVIHNGEIEGYLSFGTEIFQFLREMKISLFVKICSKKGNPIPETCRFFIFLYPPVPVPGNYPGGKGDRRVASSCQRFSALHPELRRRNPAAANASTA